MRVLTVIGNRPQFIKASAVSPLLREEHEEYLIHTGQHYDDQLSAVFFAELGLPAPDQQLGIGGGSGTSQTSRMLAALEPALDRLAPDAVLVYGDTNSTLAGAVAGAKGHVPVVHVEAGMRSFDRRMPEEVNRVVTDHLSGLCLCSTPVAVQNLQKEGRGAQAVLVGDVMADVALRFAALARERSTILADQDLKTGGFGLITAHRAGNVDDPRRLRDLVDLLIAVPEPVVLPLHPRTRARLEQAGLEQELRAATGVTVTEPLGYFELTALLCHARRVLTDSGGVQKEAYLAGVPCVTMRANTEWTETVETGWNVLVDLDVDAALAALQREPPPIRPELYGDGHAGQRVVDALSRLQR